MVVVFVAVVVVQWGSYSSSSYSSSYSSGYSSNDAGDDADDGSSGCGRKRKSRSRIAMPESAESVYLGR